MTLGCAHTISALSTEMTSRDVVVFKFGDTTTLHQWPKEEGGIFAVHTAMMGFSGFVASCPTSSFLVGPN